LSKQFYEDVLQHDFERGCEKQNPYAGTLRLVGVLILGDLKQFDGLKPGPTFALFSASTAARRRLGYGIAAEPKIANGLNFDRRLFRNHGQVWEAERRYSWWNHDGAIRVLGWLRESRTGRKLRRRPEACGRNRNHARRDGDAPGGHAEVRNRNQL